MLDLVKVILVCSLLFGSVISKPTKAPKPPDNFMIKNLRIIDLMLKNSTTSMRNNAPLKMNVRKTTTMGLLLGAIQAEGKMERQLVENYERLLRIFEKADQYELAAKIDEIERKMQRDRRAMLILKNAICLAMNGKSLSQYRNAVATIAAEDARYRQERRNVALRQMSRIESQIRMKKLKEDLDNHIKYMRNNLTETAKMAVQYLEPNKRGTIQIAFPSRGDDLAIMTIKIAPTPTTTKTTTMRSTLAPIIVQETSTNNIISAAADLQALVKREDLQKHNENLLQFSNQLFSGDFEIQKSREILMEQFPPNQNPVNQFVQTNQQLVQQTPGNQQFIQPNQQFQNLLNVQAIQQNPIPLTNFQQLPINPQNQLFLQNQQYTQIPNIPANFQQIPQFQIIQTNPQFPQNLKFQNQLLSNPQFSQKQFQLFGNNQPGNQQVPNQGYLYPSPDMNGGPDISPRNNPQPTDSPAVPTDITTEVSVTTSTIPSSTTQEEPLPEDAEILDLTKARINSNVIKKTKGEQREIEDANRQTQVEVNIVGGGEREDDDDDDFDRQTGDGGGGGIVGLIASLSGGEEGSDVGALIGAISGVITNLFGPDGLDIPSLLSTGTSLIAGLLGGEENFGTVLGGYVGTAVEGLSGGGADQNGAFFGNLIGTIFAQFSSDPEDDDNPPNPFLFLRTFLDSFFKSQIKPEKSTNEERPEGEKEGASGSGGVLGFVQNLVSSLVAGVTSFVLNASLGASGGSSQGSAELSAGASGASSSGSSSHKES